MKRYFGLLLLLLIAVLTVSSAQDALTGKKVILAGSIQAALGAKAWDSNGEITRMKEVSGGVFEFAAAFPKGSYEYKVAVGGTWDENYGLKGAKGGANIPLNVTVDGTIVKFVFTINPLTVLDSVNNPAEVKAPDSLPAVNLEPAAPAPSAVAAGVTRLTLHYSRARADFDGWNIWAWGAAPVATDGKQYNFTESDAFGKTAVIDIPGVHTKLGFIVRQGN